MKGFRSERLHGPPLLVVRGSEATLVEAPADASRLTHPQPIGDGTRLAYLDQSGAVVVRRRGTVLGSVDVDALPDARLLTDAVGRVLLLTQPTPRYGHGVLGDGLEAAAFTLIGTRPTVWEIRTVTIPRPSVVEGIAPIWVDWNGDGEREVVVTESDDNEGARVVLYAENGKRLATGPAIGLGHRWRHTIAVAPFGPSGELELAEVLTPHIGGVAGFYRWQGARLTLVAQVGGVTSHVYGSRNLDMALAGDLDGNGSTELLLPTQARRKLAAVRREDGVAKVVWQLDAGGTVVTNIGAMTAHDGRIAIAVGTKEGRLRVWGP